jgi:hypothetical protein
MRCGNCGNDELIGVEQPDGTRRQPIPGDPVVCMRCRLVQTVDSAGRVRDLTEPEIEAIRARMNELFG